MICASTGGSLRVLAASDGRSFTMFITGVFTSKGSTRVLAASNNRFSIMFITGVEKESSSYSE